MPLADYGVLVGTLNRFTREDPNNYGSWYHGKLYVDTPQGPYECAVDVSTPSGVMVQFRSIRIAEKFFMPVMSLPSGWNRLPRTATSGALDYIRSPMFHDFHGCLAIIYDPLINWINQILRGIYEHWTDSTGNNALDNLASLLTVGGKVFVFGAPYTSGQGVHDIHMNQGDPPGQFQHLDGIWQDGGVIIVRPDGSLRAFLTKFSTQSLHTDDNGLPS